MSNAWLVLHLLQQQNLRHGRRLRGGYGGGDDDDPTPIWPFVLAIIAVLLVPLAILALMLWE